MWITVGLPSYSKGSAPRPLITFVQTHHSNMALLREVTMFEDLKVQLVKTEPDLCVFVTRDKVAASGKDELWCFYDLMPEKKIKLVEDNADVRVQYVNSPAQAGWKNKTHKLIGRIG